MDLTRESLAEMRERITRQLSENTGKTQVRKKKKIQDPVADERQMSIFDVISYPHEQQSFQFEGRAKDRILLQRQWLKSLSEC